MPSARVREAGVSEESSTKCAFTTAPCLPKRYKPPMFGRQALEAERDRRFEPKPVSRTGCFPQARGHKMTDGFLWIDAEDFSDYGGWQLDTQFVHLMGSAYSSRQASALR